MLRNCFASTSNAARPTVRGGNAIRLAAIVRYNEPDPTPRCQRQRGEVEAISGARSASGLLPILLTPLHDISFVVPTVRSLDRQIETGVSKGACVLKCLLFCSVLSRKYAVVAVVKAKSPALLRMRAREV